MSINRSHPEIQAEVCKNPRRPRSMASMEKKHARAAQNFVRTEIAKLPRNYDILTDGQTDTNRDFDCT